MVEPYRKIAFQWREPRPPIAVPDRLRFRPYTEADWPELTALVGRAMNHSLDRGDQSATARRDATQAATAFIEAAGEGFDYRPEWWQFAYDGETLVGFVQPVIFRGGNRGGLAEGTIYYIGVAPEARGRGYVHDLLRKGTRVLQETGVWRIYCDTDELNAPMIAAFEKAGYKQDGEAQERPL